MTSEHAAVGQERHEAHIYLNVALQKYELRINDEVISASKHRDYWEYHQRRGDLPKAFAKYYFTKFTYHDQPATVSKLSKSFDTSLASLLEPMYLMDVCEPEPTVKKPGRPKRVTMPDDPTIHRLSDNDPTEKALSPQDRYIIRQDFHRLTELDGMTLTKALNQLADEWGISYRQAYITATT